MNTHKITEIYFIDFSKILNCQKWQELSEKNPKGFFH